MHAAGLANGVAGVVAVVAWAVTVATRARAVKKNQPGAISRVIRRIT